MKLAPSQWQGSARQLIKEVLQPHFIPTSTVEVWHNFLERRLSDGDAVYVVEAASPEQKSRWGQEKAFLTQENARIFFGDRSPAVAMESYFLENAAINTEKAAALFLHLPHHSFDLDKFSRWANFNNNVASAGWMVAQIFKGSQADAKWESLNRTELKRMTLLGLHPLNQFLFPNLNKSGAVVADDPRLHALIAEAYSKYYGPLWNSFVELTGVQVPTAGEDFQIDLSAKGKMPDAAKLESKDLIAKIEAKDAYDLKLLTINEAQGYHSRVLDDAAFTRGFFDMKLELKERSGDSRLIGFYRLNLKDLYEKKYLARDAKGIRLLVYKTPENQFAVGPKKTGPLTPLP